MNGENRMLETPALISAIVKDVQQARVASKTTSTEERHETRDTRDTRPSLEDMIELALAPGAGNVRATLTGNGGKKIDGGNNVESLEIKGKTEKTFGPSEGEMKGNAESLDVDMLGKDGQDGKPCREDHEEAKEPTPATIPISPESPALDTRLDPAQQPNETPQTGNILITPVNFAKDSHLPPPEVIVTAVDGKLDNSPRKSLPGHESKKKNSADIVDNINGYPSPWSSDLCEDQPIVSIPPPSLEAEREEELEELANAGRTHPQPLGSTHHHPSAHEHDEPFVKSVHELPFDSDDRVLYQTHSTADKSYEMSSPENRPRSPALAKPPALFRVPSVLEQMQDEPPALPTKHVLHVHGTHDAAEYKLDSAEFLSDRKDSSSSSSRSHPALQIAESLVMPTTFRDLNFRDSDGQFLAESEAADESLSSSRYSEFSKGKEIQEGNHGDGNALNCYEPECNSSGQVECDGHILKNKLGKVKTGSTDNKVKRSQGKSADELSSSSPLEQGEMRGKVCFYTEDADDENSEKLKDRWKPFGLESPLISDARIKGEVSEDGQNILAENELKIPAIWEVMNGDAELAGSASDSESESESSRNFSEDNKSDPAENGGKQREEEDEKQQEQRTDPEEGLEKNPVPWEVARGDGDSMLEGEEEDEHSSGRHSCDSSEENGHLHPKPPPGKSGRGCISAR